MSDLDLEWGETERAFRAEARAWLEANVHHAKVSAFASVEESIPVLLRWEKLLTDAGYNAVGWPKEFGGQGLAPILGVIFAEEYERARAPRRLNYPALGLFGPTLMLAGTEAQKCKLLPRVLSCEDTWCQGFSEPNAGSDLASLTTQAVRDGDHYIVNGQKTWCSNGPRATSMFTLVRTNLEAPRHRGISYLMIDLRSPGVEMRSIKQISGATLFSDVFLTDVAVPVDNLVGDENDGWNVARKTLGIERDASRYPALFFQRIINEVRVIAEAHGVLDDALSLELVRLQAAIRIYEVNFYAAFTSDRPEANRDLASMSKLLRSLLQMALSETGMQALGSNAELGPAGLPDGVGEDWHERYWHSRASMIYAGSNEIQRNLISERLLGLPRNSQ